jgi:hypothetical protein
MGVNDYVCGLNVRGACAFIASKPAPTGIAANREIGGI